MIKIARRPNRIRQVLAVLAALGLMATATAGQAHAQGPEDATSQDERTLGPNGYQTLKLGMSKKEAVATGLITDPEKVGDCTWYYLKPSEGAPNPGNGVVISPTRGVVNILGTDKMHTPEGITMGSVDDDEGSTADEIENSYLKYTVDKTGPVTTYTAPAPGNKEAHYLFALGDGDKVKDMALATDDDGGCGLSGSSAQ